LLNAKGRSIGGIKDFLSLSRRTLILIIIVAAIFNTLIAVWLSRSHNLTVPSIGTIYVTGVEAYGGDITSTNGAMTVDWGENGVGSSNSVSFFLRSASNVPIAIALSIENWEPQSIEPFMLVEWNYTGAQLAPKEEISIRFDLKTSSSYDFADYLITNNITSFSFSLHVSAVKSL
jgi:hypothetical protein